MSKKNKSIRVKLIANPGAGNPSEASLQDGLLDISVCPDFSKAELLRY